LVEVDSYEQGQNGKTVVEEAEEEDAVQTF
jgi:hypothetical protein